MKAYKITLMSVW